MPEGTHYLDVNSTLLLLTVAAAVAMSAKWIKLPYSIALVIVGLILSFSKIIPPIAMTPDLILVVFLPALLFEAAWNLNLKELKQNKLPIGILATVGVLISMLVTAGILHCLAHVDLGASLLFGSMLAATDPISVLALFKKLGLNKRLTIILEGESLFNDGTAVVLFKLMLALVISGQGFSLSATAGQFCFAVVGGIIIGLIFGLASSQITKYFDDHLPEIMLTTVAAYGSFLLADSLHVSAVLSVITAGIVIGNYGSQKSMSATTRIAVNSFWEYAAFVVNSMVFLLIGLQINLELLQKYSQLILFGILAILAARIAVIYILTPFVSSKALPISWQWRHLLFWGSLRGALCMAMALSLPLDYAWREPLIVTTFGVVLFTLLVSGLSMEPLVRLLKIDSEPVLSQRDLRLQLLEAHKDKLFRLAREESINKDELKLIKLELDQDIEKLLSADDKKEETKGS
ncbi:MAG: Na+/H+ antiporter [Candidatus Obscuribacterales bacterium]|nr:Na+/H+ antiporter [Candidatus Obscuribacterales bacterium]